MKKTARLIDANTCIAKIKDMPVTYDSETVQRCIEVISNAPTIEAIPIKWIIRNRNKHSNDGFAWIFEAVLDDWRKEHVD